MKRLLKRISGILLPAVLATVSAGGLYISKYYPVDDKVQALASEGTVTVTETEFGYQFDGPGEEAACIFYPGAKVEDLAYSCLLKKVAAGGMDCFLVHMPGNLAIFGVNAAEELIESYTYDSWYLAGHSLGGAMAASFAASHPGEVEGLALLAAYPTKDLNDAVDEVVTIYGSEDTVVNQEKLVQGRDFMPAQYEEICLEGANHAGFGTYGAQKGDGEASMDASKQQERTAEEILKLMDSVQHFRRCPPASDA